MNDQFVRFYCHLSELRSRLVQALVALVVATSCALYFSTNIVAWILLPIKSSFSNAVLIATAPTDAFIIKLQVGLLAGFIISMPFLIYQLWLFVEPALYPQEKRLAIPFVISATSFFIIGLVFCFYLALPVAFQFLSHEFLTIGVAAAIKADAAIKFTLLFLTVFGIAFQLPVFCYVGAKLHLLTAKQLFKNSRVAVVVIFVLAAIFTPPDVISQLLLAIPLLILYALCILVAYTADIF